MQAMMPAKRLELLKDMLPGIDKVVVFTNSQTADQLSVTQGTARRMGLHCTSLISKDPPFDYKAGFANAESAKADALFVLGSGLWVPGRATIVELALKARLPSVFHHLGWVEAGGLMSYGFNFPTMWRRGAEMVAAVLRGAKVGEIPMEQPNVFQLALNLKTAKALGIAVSPSIVLRADRVIE
jgi:putative ABC transport system substrate-binding protein